MFEAAGGRAPRRRAWSGIFPEGTTHDRPQLAPIRTGAARIVLGAKEMGVEGITIVPVGLWFEDKVALRSRVLVRAGEPMDVDRELAGILPPGSTASDDDREAVRRSDGRDHRTAARRVTRLRHLSRGRRILASGRHRAPRRHAPTAAVGAAGAAGTSRDAARPRSRTSAEPSSRTTSGRYSLALDALGVTDEELVPRADARPACFAAWSWLAIGVLLLAPFAIAGVLINFIPALIVLGGGPPRPVTGDEGHRAHPRRDRRLPR